MSNSEERGREREGGSKGGKEEDDFSSKLFVGPALCEYDKNDCMNTNSHLILP